MIVGLEQPCSLSRMKLFCTLHVLKPGLLDLKEERDPEFESPKQIIDSNFEQSWHSIFCLLGGALGFQVKEIARIAQYI